MPATLTLTTPIPIPNVKTITGQGAILDDPDAGTLQVTFLVGLNGGNIYRPGGQATLTCKIANGQADGIRAKSGPANEQDYVEVFTTSTGVASAYTSCKSAYQASGRAGLMAQMQTLGLLGAGAIV